MSRTRSIANYISISQPGGSVGTTGSPCQCVNFRQSHGEAGQIAGQMSGQSGQFNVVAASAAVTQHGCSLLFHFLVAFLWAELWQNDGCPAALHTLPSMPEPRRGKSFFLFSLWWKTNRHRSLKRPHSSLTRSCWRIEPQCVKIQVSVDAALRWHSATTGCT